MHPYLGASASKPIWKVLSHFLFHTILHEQWVPPFPSTDQFITPHLSSEAFAPLDITCNTWQLIPQNPALPPLAYKLCEEFFLSSSELLGLRQSSIYNRLHSTT
jgi:hypothetical protein